MQKAHEKCYCSTYYTKKTIPCTKIKKMVNLIVYNVVFRAKEKIYGTRI